MVSIPLKPFCRNPKSKSISQNKKYLKVVKQRRRRRKKILQRITYLLPAPEKRNSLQKYKSLPRNSITCLKSQRGTPIKNQKKEVGRKRRGK